MTSTRFRPIGFDARPGTLLALALVGAVLTGAAIAVPDLLLRPAAANAVTAERGPMLQIPGWGDLGAFILSNGKNAYCIERSTVTAVGPFRGAEVLDELPRATAKGGAVGTTPALTSAKRMRQLNYILDVWGQTTSPSRAAKVQTAVWIIRNDTGMDWWLANLKATARGKAVYDGAVAMIETAAEQAVAPVAPKPIVGQLEVSIEASGEAGRVTYPAGGVRSITLKDAEFTETTTTTTTTTTTIASGLSRDGGAFTFRPTVPTDAPFTVKATAKWRTEGTRGWEPELQVFTPATDGDQRSAYATGASTPEALTGTLTASGTYAPAPQPMFELSSRAQAESEVGGTLTDTIIVSGNAAGILQPGSVDAVAYLEPNAGSPKYGEDWEPLEDPDEPGAVLRWTAAELDAMSAEERCTAQPVVRAGRGDARIPVTGEGSFATDPVEARSAGIVFWVERYWQGDIIVAQGRCGISEERTVIDTPGVETRAMPEAVIGQVVTDTATISGRLAAEADYWIVFEAFSARRDPQGRAVCEAGNRVFRSEAVPVRELGEVESPGFTTQRAHGATIWWVETLGFTSAANGASIPIARGECGIENETTRVLVPEPRMEPELVPWSEPEPKPQPELMPKPKPEPEPASLPETGAGDSRLPILGAGALLLVGGFTAAAQVMRGRRALREPRR